MKFWQFIPAVLLCALLPLHAAAADTCTLAALPVSVNCACTVMLEPLDGAPPPDAAQLHITGGQGSFGGFVYTVPGDYRYRLRMSSTDTSGFLPDTTSYLVTVQVTNGEHGTLTPAVVAVKEQGAQQEKSAELRFAARTLPAKPAPAPAVQPTQRRTVLAQTGQLRWPVPLLCGGGLAGLLSGKRRKRR